MATDFVSSEASLFGLQRTTSSSQDLSFPHMHPWCLLGFKFSLLIKTQLNLFSALFILFIIVIIFLYPKVQVYYTEGKEGEMLAQTPAGRKLPVPILKAFF